MGRSEDARIRSVRSPQDAAARKGRKDSVFPARNPPPPRQGEGCASGLIPMNLEKGLLGARPRPRNPPAAPAPVALTGSTGEVWSLCLVAFRRRMQEPPLQTPCFTGSPPVADLLTGKASAEECKDSRGCSLRSAAHFLLPVMHFVRG